MLIGIDMIGVQSPGASDREAGRYARQLVRALLARDPVNRYVLYTHDGLSTEPIPSASNALRVPLPAASGRPNARRAAIQRVLDRGPHGLDWLILPDPFAVAYDGLPPEAPLNGPGVASVIHDPAPSTDRDRPLIPLRRHDAVLAVSGEVATDYRSLMGGEGDRVSMIGLASDETFEAPGPAEPLTRCAGVELGRMGIRGSYLLTRISRRPSTAELESALDPYRRLPLEHRRSYQLVVNGAVDDPGPIVAHLREHGAEGGLVMVGEVPESTLSTLYGRCSAFLAHGGGSGLALVEAMKCGAPVIGDRSSARTEILGDAGLLVDPSDPSRLASALDDLLSDDRLASDLRHRGLGRSARFSFDSVVDALLAALDGAISKTSTRLRRDPGHSTRPRVAVFLDFEPGSSSPPDLDSRLPADWLEPYAIDVYLDPGLSTLADGLPTEFGGFDARLFGRNDAILGYHAVVDFLDGPSRIDAKLGRLASRPGLVVLDDGPWLDRSGPSAPDAARLRELFLTGSRVAVRSPGLLDRIARTLPEFVDQLVEIPPSVAFAAGPDLLRVAARSRLDLLPETLAIGLFGRWEASIEAVTRAIPDATFLSFDADLANVGPRSNRPISVSSDEARDVIPALDLALYFGASEASTIPGLLRAGVPAIAIDNDPVGTASGQIISPDADESFRPIVELASDPEARSAYLRSAHAAWFGTPDPRKALKLLLEQVELCAVERRRGSGRPLHRAHGSRGLTYSPHFPRAASATGEAASRRR